MSDEYDPDEYDRDEYDTDAYETDEYDRDAYDADDTNPAQRGKWISAIIALAGLWLIVEAIWFDLLLGNFWNDVIVGVLLIALGGYNFYRRSNDQLASTAAAALSALLGLWLIVSPWVYDVDIGAAEVTTELGFWNDVVVGLIVLILGAYSAYEARDVDVGTPVER